MALHGGRAIEIIFGGKPAPTYHKEKLRNERVRDNKMKCVRAVSGELAGWHRVVPSGAEWST